MFSLKRLMSIETIKWAMPSSSTWPEITSVNPESPLHSALTQSQFQPHISSFTSTSGHPSRESMSLTCREDRLSQLRLNYGSWLSPSLAKSTLLRKTTSKEKCSSWILNLYNSRSLHKGSYMFLVTLDSPDSTNRALPKKEASHWLTSSR